MQKGCNSYSFKKGVGKMNGLLFSSLISLIIFYVLSISVSFGTAFIIFFLTLILMGGAAYLEASAEKKRIKHLRLVK